MKYIKKPIEVEALQWTGDNFDNIQKMFGFDNELAWLHHTGEPGGVIVDELYVMTVDGNRCHVPLGAFVVKDTKGYPYPHEQESFVQNHSVNLSLAVGLHAPIRKYLFIVQLNGGVEFGVEEVGSGRSTKMVGFVNTRTGQLKDDIELNKDDLLRMAQDLIRGALELG